MTDFETNIALSPHARACMDDYIRSTVGLPFRGDVSDEDEMYHQAIAAQYPTDFAYFKYIESGRRTHDVMGQFFDHYFGGADGVGRYLEFASGHGRATRFLLGLIPAERYWASDIYEDAMTYQREYFGTHTIQSHADPDDVEIDGSFDAITAMSLFTHLPADLFGRWLTKLAAHLSDQGVLFITVREKSTAPSTHDTTGIDEHGIAYATTSESRSLSHEIYGMTTVTDAFMRAQIAAHISPEARVHRYRRGLYENQDIYAISMRPDFKPLDLKRPPLGDRYELWVPTDGGRTLVASGWGLDMNPGQEIVHFEATLDGQDVGAVPMADYEAADFALHFPGIDSQPKSWVLRFPVEALKPNAVLKVRVVSGTGSAVEYYAPPISARDRMR